MNKKTLNLLAICVVVLGVSFLYAQKHSIETEKVFGNNITVDKDSETTVAFADADTYQLDLLQTIAEQNIAAFEKVSDSFKKSSTDTLSESIAKDVFGEYLKYNTSGDLDVAKLQAMTTSAIKNQIPDVVLTQMQSLRIVPSSITNLTIYTEQISQIQSILNQKISSIATYKDQAPYIQNLYAAAVKIFLEVPVPENIAQYHLKLIHGYENYVEGFRLMQLQSSDPAKALLGVQVAQTGNTEAIDALTNIKRIILLNKIVYNTTDKAYAWLTDVAEGEKIKTQ